MNAITPIIRNSKPLPAPIYFVINQWGEILDGGDKRHDEAVSYVRHLNNGDRIAMFDAREFCSENATMLRDVTEEMVREAYEAGEVEVGDVVVGVYLGMWSDDDQERAAYDASRKLEREYRA